MSSRLCQKTLAKIAFAKNNVIKAVKKCLQNCVCENNAICDSPQRFGKTAYSKNNNELLKNIFL
jgi:hypothetical protein